MTKYIFVTGGVISGIGKGITTASLGRLLINRGFKVIVVKIDPYLNVDAGVMNPFQHGEVFVTCDGAETDLDLGNYERFFGIDLNKYSNFTTGSVYSEVIAKERRGDYLGQTVQLIPHITDEIKSRIYQIGKDNEAEIVITEIGGTIGDFEMPPFVEAIRQMAVEVGRENTLFLHVSLIYTLPNGESKSKPTQHSIRKLQELGFSQIYCYVVPASHSMGRFAKKSHSSVVLVKTIFLKDWTRNAWMKSHSILNDKGWGISF